MLKVCAMLALDTVVPATPLTVMVPPATVPYGEPAGSAVGASSYSLIVSTTVSPLAKVMSLGAIAGQCSLPVNVPAGPLSASILPVSAMLTVFALATGAAAAPAFAPPHADAETATAPSMSPTASIFRGGRLLESIRFTVITLSGWGGRSCPVGNVDPSLRAGVPV